MGDAHVGLHARLMSQALRNLTAACAKSKTMVIFINQLRMKIGVMFGNPETTTGGNALKFYASVRLDIRRIGALKDGDKVVGNRTKVKVVKNKLAAPFREVEFDIGYGSGISLTGEIIDLGVDSGLLEKSGAWVAYRPASQNRRRPRACRRYRVPPHGHPGQRPSMLACTRPAARSPRVPTVRTRPSSVLRRGCEVRMRGYALIVVAALACNPQIVSQDPGRPGSGGSSGGPSGPDGGGTAVGGNPGGGFGLPAADAAASAPDSAGSAPQRLCPEQGRCAAGAGRSADPPGQLDVDADRRRHAIEVGHGPELPVLPSAAR
jgi:hypothetical protein